MGFLHRSRRRRHHALARRMLLASALVLSGVANGATARSEPGPTTQPDAHWYLLHLPGIAGARYIDHSVTQGIREGGFPGMIDIYDWTEHDPGLDALVSRARNQREAQHVAEILTHEVTTHPGQIVDLLSHSGGGGIALWALEDLSPGIHVHDVILMSPAVSPTFDLTKALTHVDGHLYVFSSLADLLVLGTGTRLFGTIDGVNTDAAGRVGFIRPATADPAEYRKLIPEPYDPTWTRYNDFGDHRGGMTRLFGKDVLAPLLLKGTLPPARMPYVVETPTGLGRSATPATQPTTE